MSEPAPNTAVISGKGIAGIPRGLINRLGWTTIAMGVGQAMRMANNVVLAHLLAPAVFGILMIAYTIKTGVDLLSDTGLNQSIVSSKRGEEPLYYDTAWTIQVIRGVLLATVFGLLGQPIARFYGEPQLATIIPIMGLLFLFGGFASTSRALLQKRLAVVRADIFELSILAFTIVLQIALALVIPNVWSLVIAGVVSGAVGMVASYFVIPGMRHRLVIDRQCALDIFHFSKWIFLATAIYFFAWNFDRLYFGKQIPLVELGVFAIARSLTDMISASAAKFCNSLLFPTVAAMTGSKPEVRARLLKGRRNLLALVAVGLGGLVALADPVVQTLYDDRYAAAGTYLPLLLLGSWFALLCTINESIMLGVARPALPAFGNAAKLLTYIVLVPLAFLYSGLIAAILVLVLGDLVRYVVLWAIGRRHHLGFGREDLGLTILFFVSVVGSLAVLGLVGIGSGFANLLNLAGL